MIAVIAAAAMIADSTEREANFQAAWYYSLLLFVILMMVIASFVVAQRAVRPMWRAGERGPALAIAAATTVALLFLLSMLITVAVALLPAAAGRGG